MSGITGIIHKNALASEQELRPLLTLLSHRGPDGEGFYIDGSVGLAHKQLSPIDPENGAQPMRNEDGSVVITYDGAIYNYLDLRQELIQKNHQFRSCSDAEVILHAYEEYGEACLDKFNGMFAFVIWDSRHRRIFGARDRFGVKPFYYCHSCERFAFASEIKALVKAGLLTPEINSEGVMDYIVFQYTFGPKTMFKGIYKIEPGHSFTLDTDTFEFNTKQYWDLCYEIDTYHTEDYYIDKLLFLLNDATKIRLRCDVPIGSYLSGGLDSSTVVCLASDLLGNSTLNTFTGKFNEGSAYDETKYAKLVSEFAATKYHEVIPTVKDFEETFPKIIYALDEPGAGPGVFPQYMASKLASKHVKVVLGGQGGDEIFFGYARYMVAHLEECIKGAIWDYESRDKHSVTLESIVPNLSVLDNYKPMMQNFFRDGLFGPQDARYYRLIDRSESVTDIFQKDYLNSMDYSPFESFQKVFNRGGIGSYINKMLYTDIKGSLPAMLNVEDRTGMAFGMETRLPLLDYRISELIASMPPTIKFRGGNPKGLFKHAVRNIVPPEIIQRKDKMGFPVPLVEWMSGPLNTFVKDILLSDSARRRGIYHVDAIELMLHEQSRFSRIAWGLICLETWFRTFID